MSEYKMSEKKTNSVQLQQKLEEFKQKVKTTFSSASDPESTKLLVPSSSSSSLVSVSLPLPVKNHPIFNGSWPDESFEEDLIKDKKESSEKQINHRKQRIALLKSRCRET